VRKVAIIIPCYNEEKFIAACILSCLSQQNNGFELEILVCDGMSVDKTISIVNGISAKHPNVKLIPNPKRITPVALNLGIKNTNAEIIIILGAHSELFPDYVKNCLKALDEHPDAACVGGIIESEYSDGISNAIGLAQSASFGVGNAYFRTGRSAGYVDTVAFGAYRREAFEKAGYFDEELIRNQDDELNFRLLKSGFRIFLDPSIRSGYFVRASYKKLFRQYYQYGFWKVYANKKNSSITTVRQLIPFFFVAFLFFFPLSFFISHWFFYLYAAILSLYLVLALFSALSSGKTFDLALKMVPAFFILHFSYGLGYLYGIFYFLVMGKRPPAHQNISR
jgi:glycosyltransferase involved in cell wall biosynthesis